MTEWSTQWARERAIMETCAYMLGDERRRLTDRHMSDWLWIGGGVFNSLVWC